MRLVLLLAISSLALSAPATAQAEGGSGCDRCHGELEFLRQHAPDLDGALRMQVTGADILASAHRENSCTDCHNGFTRWPHPETSATETCASCHREAEEAWRASVHGRPDELGADPVECASCHSIHAVAEAEAVREGPAMLAMNVRCVDCHETSGLPAWDPHADTVGCASCHAHHATLDVDDPGAAVAPLTQRETCGACHGDQMAASSMDVHGRSLAERAPMSLATLELLAPDGPATCSSCHGSHGMRAVTDPLAHVELQDRCSACHADHAERYYGTYHGKATALGSEIVATCADCHSAHEIYPADEPASWVHGERLVQTCGECHQASRAAFVLYDSHPDPMDPTRNAPLFFSFVFMNTLLIGVLIVFGLHTLLWWVRILIDQRRGGGEAHHG
ncbi:MAG TPA: cytochrome c3 family protein [Longimicrobiales bacterium]|nr:cytochrome c3 family protein [Longimicrobiales bacterium]